MMDQKVIPVSVYRVGNTCFDHEQIRAMIERTNTKLAVARIKIEIVTSEHIARESLAYVQDVPGGNVEDLLQLGRGVNKRLRIFLVKLQIGPGIRLDSWTYDPLKCPEDVDLWGGAVFITELFNDNSDARYEDMGYLPSNDTLLHELGHVLMQESEHYQGQRRNFFHELSEKTDDSIFAYQVRKLRASSYLRSP